MLCFLLAAAMTPSHLDRVSAQREFRAVWIATVANIDWPSKPGLTSAQMKKEMIAILDVCARNRFNAVVFQVRPHGDALYKSDLEPWSYYLTGQQGKAPDSGFDPLQTMVEEAHKRGIEVHCWLNPFRANHPGQRTPMSRTHYGSRHPSAVPTYGKYKWMDPGDQGVQDHSFSVFMDVVERYDIDGVHMDDYFYPYPAYGNGADFPDGKSWRAYLNGGGGLSRGDWRRDNVNRFVKRLYEGVKERKPWVKVGVSPFGIYRPGQPQGVKTTFDQYGMLYADCLLWLQEGWLDYFTPQLYWRISGDQSYPVLLDWWMSKNTMQRHLWPGNNASALDPAIGNWQVKELENQIETTRERAAGGNVFYSMKPFMKNTKQVNYALRRRAFSEPALVPETPWLGGEAPPVPRCELTGDGKSLTLMGADTLARFYAIYVDRGEGLALERVIGSEVSVVTDLNLESAVGVGITVVSKTGIEGPMQTVK